MNVKLLTEHHLEFLSLKGGCTGSSEFTLVKMSHCWKSRHGSFVLVIFEHYTNSVCFSFSGWFFRAPLQT